MCTDKHNRVFPYPGTLRYTNLDVKNEVPRSDFGAFESDHLMGLSKGASEKGQSK